MTIQQQIEVMQHFADGGKVEILDEHRNEWIDAPKPRWDWISYDYRIKPEPFKQEIVFTKGYPRIDIEDFEKISKALGNLKFPMMYKMTIEEVF